MPSHALLGHPQPAPLAGPRHVEARGPARAASICPLSTPAASFAAGIGRSLLPLAGGSARRSMHQMAASSGNGASASGALGEDLPSTYADVFDRPLKGRRAGVILHPTSLPGKYGIGELGAEAIAFIDWLADSGCQLWQVLPLVPPDKYGSPYSSTDALCGNTLLVALDELVAEGLLDPVDLPAAVPVADVDFLAVAAAKGPLLDKAAGRLVADARFKYLQDDLAEFRRNNPWIEDSALFAVLSALPENEGLNWWEWEQPLARRDPAALQLVRAAHADELTRFIVKQFLFDRQWNAVKEYARAKKVLVVGDMPIYVGGHSADVWANSGLFSLSDGGEPVLVSGVPPDAFSDTGQLWGSPLYDWQAHAADGYRWWVQRLGRAFQLYDEVRIDHFRGFAGYWAVEGWRETAMEGVWKRGPGEELFKALKQSLGSVPILAEDLGVITQDVDDLRNAIGAPGMLVLQFAWGSGARNLYLPHNAYENAFVYPGTHDNETTVGWWRDTADAKVKRQVQDYFGVVGAPDDVDVAGLLIRAACASIARTAVFQMQDVMRLDNGARMNTPGKAVGNWGWRVGDSSVWGQLQRESQELRDLCKLYDRLPPKPKKAEGAATDEAAEGEAPAPAKDEAPAPSGFFSFVKSLIA